jgi:hypothetical protein
VGDECTMALLWGLRTASVIDTCRDAVYENFGPFDIGPCREFCCQCEGVGVFFLQ